MGYLEFLTYYDPYDEEIHQVDHWVLIESHKEDIRRGISSFFILSQSPFSLTGPAYGPNFGSWMLKMKEAFDPNGISSPPFPHDIDELVDHIDWLKRDW